MKRRKSHAWLHVLTAILMVVAVLASCKGYEYEMPDPDFPMPPGAIPVTVDIPNGFPPMNIPEDNPFTEEGIDLGRHLFWEVALSGDFTMSCGTCHSPETSFSDADQFSTGIDGIQGTRQSMALINIAWANDYTWDGRMPTVESQMIEPVQNPIEMHLEWTEAVERLEEMPIYVEKFAAAFGAGPITQENAAKALAQFVRTMISGNSLYDQIENDVSGQLTYTDSQERGFFIFIGECNIPTPFGELGGDCFHCHSPSGRQFTDYLPHNNGLDASFSDLGYGGINNNPLDNGKFKTPTLRNVEYSAPYMHDGRFQTLEEVIDHYNTGIIESSTVDPFVTKCLPEGLLLSEQGKIDLINFLKTLSDPEFISNPAFSDPHQ